MTESAFKELTRIPQRTRDRIISRLRTLEEKPRQHGTVKLQGYRSLYRIRIGDYRVIFDLGEAEKIVKVMRIAPRSSAYD